MVLIGGGSPIGSSSNEKKMVVLKGGSTRAHLSSLKGEKKLALLMLQKILGE